jgi:hypothetical protein
VNRNNPGHTAGVTFFGQFLDHDLTFDPARSRGWRPPPRYPATPWRGHRTARTPSRVGAICQDGPMGDGSIAGG